MLGIKDEIESILRTTMSVRTAALENVSPTAIADLLSNLQLSVDDLVHKVDHAVEGIQYSSPDVPAGFITVLAYIHREFPDWLARQRSPAAATIAMGKHCAEVCRKLDLEFHRVASPVSLKVLDVEYVNAYPENVVALVVDAALA